MGPRTKISRNLSTRCSWYHGRQPEVFLQQDSHCACREVLELRPQTSKRVFSGWNQRFKFWVFRRVCVIQKKKSFVRNHVFFVRKKQNFTQIFERHFQMNYSVSVRDGLVRKQRARSSSAPPAMPSVNQDRLVLKFPIGAASQTLLYTGVKLRLRPWLRKWRPHLTLQGSRPLQFSQKIPVYSLLIWHGIVLWSICGYVTSVFTFCQGLLRVSRWVSVITCFLVMPSCSRVWLSWFQLTSKYFNRLQPCEGNTAQVYSRTSSNSHLSTNGHFFWRTVHTLAREQQTHFRSSLLRPEIRLLFHRQSIHWLLFKPLYNGHFLLSPRWPLWRGSTVLFLD